MLVARRRGMVVVQQRRTMSGRGPVYHVYARTTGAAELPTVRPATPPPRSPGLTACPTFCGGRCGPGPTVKKISRTGGSIGRKVSPLLYLSIATLSASPLTLLPLLSLSLSLDLLSLSNSLSLYGRHRRRCRQPAGIIGVIRHHVHRLP